METNVADERVQFVRDFARGHWSMTELCERYGVTRPTGYKWVARHAAAGARGLMERSRAPHTCPHPTSEAVEALVVAARRHAQRTARTPPSAAEESAPSEVDASRRDRAGDDAPEPGLACRFQRPVQDRRWPLLRSVDRDGSFQPCLAGVSRTPLGEDRACPARVSRAVPRARLARRDSHGQRRAVPLDRHPWLVAPQCVGDAARDRSPADSAGEFSGERPA